MDTMILSVLDEIRADWYTADKIGDLSIWAAPQRWHKQALRCLGLGVPPHREEKRKTSAALKCMAAQQET